MKKLWKTVLLGLLALTALTAVALAAETQTTRYVGTSEELMALLKGGTADTCIVLEGKEYVIYDTESYVDAEGNEHTDETGITAAGLRNVTIRGVAGTEILSHENAGGYAVITFDGCTDVVLESLSIGHKDSWCGAPVLELRSSGITLTGCDLWGCGFYGIDEDEASSVTATGTAIRDCAAFITNLNGTASFTNCTFSRNGYDSFYREKVALQGSPKSAVFTNCTFQDNENTVKVPEEEDGYTFTGCTETNNGWQIEVYRGDCGENLKYTLTVSDGRLVISGTGKMDGPSFNTLDVDILTVEIGEGATSISAGAFNICEKLTRVSIPESVTSIGESAFGWCSALEEVALPKGLKELGQSAFSGCSALPEITLPQGLTALGDYMFSGCSSLRRIDVPAGIREIGRSTLYNCENLAEVNLPEGVTSIGDYAFYHCKKLENLKIPAAVTGIGESAFYGAGLKAVVYGGDQEALKASAEAAGGNGPLLSAVWTAPLYTVSGGVTTVRLPFSEALPSGTAVYAALYAGDGRMETLASGTLEGTSAVFRTALNDSAVVFFLEPESLRPVRSALPVFPGNGGSSTNYAYTISDKMNLEAYDADAEEYTWTRDVVVDGQVVELTEVTDGSEPEIKYMVQGDWYEVKYLADGTVKRVQLIADEITSGEHINTGDQFVFWRSDPTATHKFVGLIKMVEPSAEIHDTVILKEDLTAVLNVISVKGNSLQIDTQSGDKRGFAVAPDAKIVLVQDVVINDDRDNPDEMKDVYEYDNGVDGLEDAIGDLESNETFYGVVSAVFDDGVATSVVIWDQTARNIVTTDGGPVIYTGDYQVRASRDGTGNLDLVISGSE